MEIHVVAGSNSLSLFIHFLLGVILNVNVKYWGGK